MINMSTLLIISFASVAFSLIAAIYRIVLGPHTHDRVIALNSTGIVIVGLCAVLCVATGREWYIDIAIAWALQNFISMLALSKSLEGRDFDE